MNGELTKNLFSWVERTAASKLTSNKYFGEVGLLQDDCFEHIT